MNLIKILKLCILIIFLLLLGGCEKWDGYYTTNSEEVAISLWEALESDPLQADFVALAREVGLDEIISSERPFTIFLPAASSLKSALDGKNEDEKMLGLHYLVSNGVVLPSQFENLRKVGALNQKFLYVSKNLGEVFVEGVKVLDISPLYKNGVIYYLEGYPELKPNIEELIESQCPSLKQFIESSNIKEVDWEQSVVTGTNSEGLTVYDTAWIESNTFYDAFFQTSQESRDLFATVNLFSQELYDKALERDVKNVFNIEAVPLKWQNEVLFPWLVQNMVYEGLLDYSEFTDTMVNIAGDSVQTNYHLLDPDSKTECSNGRAYFYDSIVVPKELILDTITIEGEDLITENNEWIDSVLTNKYSKIPRVSPSDLASGGASLQVALARTGDEGYFVEFKVENLLPIQYKLVWQAYYIPSGKISFSVNGVDVGVHDNFLFRKPSSWGEVEFLVNHLTEFGDVTVRMTFVDGGIYKNSNALFFDCIKFIPVVEE